MNFIHKHYAYHIILLYWKGELFFISCYFYWSLISNASKIMLIFMFMFMFMFMFIKVYHKGLKVKKGIFAQNKKKILILPIYANLVFLGCLKHRHLNTVVRIVTNIFGCIAILYSLINLSLVIDDLFRSKAFGVMTL